MNKSRNWCGTLNNPTSNGRDWLDAVTRGCAQLKFLVFQREEGKNETPHFQFYAEFKGSKTLDYVKKVFVRAHLEKRRGNRQQAIEYCIKDEGRIAGPWWYPVELKLEDYANKPGKRNDLLVLYDAIKSGKRKRWLFDNHTISMFRFGRVYDRLQPLMKPKMRDKVEVVLMYGPPGSGKTWSIFGNPDIDQNEVWTPPIGKGGWYDGYDGQEIVVFDDFMGAGSHLSLSDLLRVLDRYPVQTPVKTAFCWFNPAKIYITTNYSPEKWYTYGDRQASYRAIERRVDRVITCHKDESGYHQCVVQDKNAWFEMLWNAKVEEEEERAKAASLLCKLKKYNN